jgi:hypothetical protein
MSIIQGTSKAAGGGYEINQSCRFNDGDTPELSRTYTLSAPWTFSAWVKRGELTSENLILGATAGEIHFNADDTLEAETTSSTARFRDPSAWYHIHVSDGGMYVNGVSHGAVTTTALTNTKLFDDFDGYAAEVHLQTGTSAYTNFGESNTDGVWIPKSATAGDTYLKFANSADFGTNSGTGGAWTATNLATADQMLDTPTLNYCTLNSIDNDNMLLSDGNLTSKSAANAHNAVSATFSIPESGTSYFEFTCDDDPSTANAVLIGVIEGPNTAQNSYTTDGPTLDFLWLVSTYNGLKSNGSGQETYGSGFSTGQVGMCAINRSSNKIWWGNATTNTWFASGDPAAGSNEAFSNLPATGNLTPIMGNSSTPQQVTFNFGQSGFLRTPPTGFNALSTANLPTPTVTDGSAHFQPTLYTGTGASNAVSQSGNSTFQPDFAWIKKRSGATEHVLTDAVRGVTKELSSNDNGAEETVAQGLTTFGSAGFTVGTDGSYNTSSATYVGWQWKANGAGSSNTDGSITSTVSNNSTAGFSIGTYTGIGTGPGDAPGTVGHGLGISPGMIIIKDLTAATEWYVWHQGMSNPAQSFIYLNTTGAAQTSTATWNNTAPTSSVFSIGWDTNVNTSGNSHVFYAFAEIPGYSSFGSYTGNGSANGTFIYTGFKPAFVIMKNISAVKDWIIYDDARDPDNFVNKRIYANESYAEDPHASNDHVDFLSNGFKQSSAGTMINASGSTYIYMAFAENPFGGDGVAPTTAR